MTCSVCKRRSRFRVCESCRAAMETVVGACPACGGKRNLHVIEGVVRHQQGECSYYLDREAG